MSMRKKKMDVFDVLNYVVLTLLIIIIVYPFLYVVVNSFNALSSHLARTAYADDVSDRIQG